jgi:hypothetical protein
MFYKCPKPRDDGQCKYFQWEDEPPRADGMGGSHFPSQTSPGIKGPPAGGASGACFKCGQVCMPWSHFLGIYKPHLAYQLLHLQSLKSLHSSPQTV